MIKKLFIFSILIFFSCNLFSQTDATGIVVYEPLNNSSRVAIKTNLLYDAVLVPNIGVEVNCYKNFTIYTDLMYAGWGIPSKHFYWNLYGLQAGIRKYFGRQASKRSFTGHHVGFYGNAFAYDLQAGHIGQQTPTVNLGGGVDYGYSFPVTPALNIDVELGFGYLGGKYYEYIVEDDHNTWQGTIRRAWWGPTKASVSLVWLIRSKKTSKQKFKK